MFKLNVDGAMFPTHHSANIKIILRYCQVEVPIMIASKKGQEVSDTARIEMLAILMGLQLSVYFGMNNLIIESNSMILVKELQQVSFLCLC